MAKWDFNRSPGAGLPASQLTCVAWDCAAQPRDVGVGATAGSVLSPAESHHSSGAAALAMLHLGSWGLAISLGPAQLWCHYRFAEEVQCPLTWIFLDSTVWRGVALHFISSHGSPPKGDFIPICFICVILVHGTLCLHLMPASLCSGFSRSLWLWKTESIKCSRRYGSLHISGQCISYSFFHKLRAHGLFVVKQFVCVLFFYESLSTETLKTARFLTWDAKLS